MKKLIIKTEYCKSCSLCIQVCPENALSTSKSFNSHGLHPAELTGNCINCGQCFIICPDCAIEIKENEAAVEG